MSIDKFAVVRKLLIDLNLQISTELPESLKCVHCKSVLKVACQVPCGCKLCRSCIEQLVSGNNETCPGKSADCREASLAEYVIDYQANKVIMRLVVNCPEENCQHRCELLDMEEHMQSCPKKRVKCSFHEFGCEQKVILSEINEHFLSENYSHFSKLIGIIYNIKNELAGLRREEAAKDKTIQFLTDAVARVENENKLIKNQIKSIQMAMLDDDHPPGELGSIGNESIELVPSEAVFLRSRNNSTKLTDDSEELRQWRDRVDRDLAEISHRNSVYQSDLLRRVSVAEKSISRQIHAYYVWMLDTVQTGQWVWSEYFRGSARHYNHRLGLCNNKVTSQLYVVLYLHAGPRDTELSWPFRGSVGITVHDRSKSKACKSIWRSCQLPRPPEDSYECTERFVFEYGDWTGAMARLDSGLTVTCVICLD